MSSKWMEKCRIFPLDAHGLFSQGLEGGVVSSQRLEGPHQEGLDGQCENCLSVEEKQREVLSQKGESLENNINEINYVCIHKLTDSSIQLFL